MINSRFITVIDKDEEQRLILNTYVNQVASLGLTFSMEIELIPEMIHEIDLMILVNIAIFIKEKNIFGTFSSTHAPINSYLECDVSDAITDNKLLRIKMHVIMKTNMISHEVRLTSIKVGKKFYQSMPVSHSRHT